MPKTLDDQRRSRQEYLGGWVLVAAGLAFVLFGNVLSYDLWRYSSADSAVMRRAQWNWIYFSVVNLFGLILIVLGAIKIVGSWSRNRES